MDLGRRLPEFGAAGSSPQLYAAGVLYRVGTENCKLGPVPITGDFHSTRRSSEFLEA
jgi:hypothetical protein